jgi:hypothetical protein
MISVEQRENASRLPLDHACERSIVAVTCVQDQCLDRRFGAFSMMTDMSWLYWVAHSAAQIVLFGIYIAGLVVCLRRWHVGCGTRWAAAGFLALIFNSLSNVGLSLLFYVFPLNSGSALLSIGDLVQLYSIMSQLIAIAGSFCLVMGVRSLAISVARRDNAVLRAFDEA